MHSLFWTGRLVSHALWNRVTNFSTATEPLANKKPQLLSAVCGFPKDFHESKLPKGKFGDDAWFAAKWKSADVLGVADGVGGWKDYGIDPGEFSKFLMKTCERFVTTGKFNEKDPCRLLAASYYEIFENKQQILGSSTACILILNRDTSTIYTANIGDSGFVIVRHGKVVHKSEEQQHYFNTPYQLGIPPESCRSNVIADSPESADTSNFHVEDGDVILLATDGVFDNVPQHMLLTELNALQGERDLVRIQKVANSIALMARCLAFDRNHNSPFTTAAWKHGIRTQGGKPDDITVLLATVVFS